MAGIEVLVMLKYEFHQFLTIDQTQVTFALAQNYGTVE